MRRTYKRFRPQVPEKNFKVNQLIRSPRVLLIDEEGVGRGEVSLAEALALANDAGLDLVEVNPTATPPIAKILDFGQFKYEKDKKAQKQKAQQKKTDLKCVRLSVRIGEHDLNVRLEQAKKFLSRGDKLKIELIMRGRERQHINLGEEVLRKFVSTLRADEELSIATEEGLTRQGGRITMVLTNKKS